MHGITGVENKEKASKCQQFALRADFSMNVAAVVVALHETPWKMHSERSRLLSLFVDCMQPSQDQVQALRSSSACQSDPPRVHPQQQPLLSSVPFLTRPDGHFKSAKRNVDDKNAGDK